MDNNKKKPKEPVQQEPVEMPTNNAPEDWEDDDNTRPDSWAARWGGAQ